MTLSDLVDDAVLIVWLVALLTPVVGLSWCLSRFVGGRTPSWRQVSAWSALYLGGVVVIVATAHLTGRSSQFGTREGGGRLLPPFDVIDPIITPGIVIIAANFFLAVRDRRRATRHHVI